MLTRCFSTVVLVALTGTTVYAQQTAGTGPAIDGIPMPEFRVGDRWVFQEVDLWTKQVTSKFEQAVEKLELPNSVYFRYNYLASSDPGRPVGSTGTTRFRVDIQDRSRGNLLGGSVENVHFPLKEGMTWKYSWKMRYVEGDIVDGEYTAKAVGWEEVKVPAGTFKAMKIEHNGWWYRREKGWSGREDFTLWFAPDVKRIIRLIAIERNTSGDIHRQSENQLVEYQLVNSKAP